MPKQINGVDIDEFRRQLNVVNNYCPSEFGMIDKLCTDREDIDCLECWINAINREVTANAETKTQTETTEICHSSAE